MFNMATITINVKDDVAKEFRQTVKEEFGEGKGKLGTLERRKIPGEVRDRTSGTRKTHLVSQNSSRSWRRNRNAFAS